MQEATVELIRNRLQQAAIRSAGKRQAQPITMDANDVSRISEAGWLLVDDDCFLNDGSGPGSSVLTALNPLLLGP